MKRLFVITVLFATLIAFPWTRAADAAGPAMVRRRAATPSLQFPTAFSRGSNGWQSGFADYSIEMSDLALESGIEPLPPELGVAESAFRISGHNRSDDLFMFLKKKIGGLQPGATYQVSFRIVFASNAGSNCVGIGGAPGEAVTLKAGASETEPLSILRGDLHYRMNVDIGQQTSGGTAASVAGNIANGSDDCRDGAPFVVIERIHTHATPIRASESGELWLLIGTDSGYEGKTTLFYRQIDVTLVRK